MRSRLRLFQAAFVLSHVSALVNFLNGFRLGDAIKKARENPGLFSVNQNSLFI
jgi:hypothetical protein